jgi:hypothetical protein
VVESVPPEDNTEKNNHSLKELIISVRCENAGFNLEFDLVPYSSTHSAICPADVTPRFCVYDKAYAYDCVIMI